STPSSNPDIHKPWTRMTVAAVESWLIVMAACGYRAARSEQGVRVPKKNSSGRFTGIGKAMHVAKKDSLDRKALFFEPARKAVAELSAALALCVPLMLGCVNAFAADRADDEEWIQLFNGKNLDGWTPKITGYEYGENYANTFRVEDGMI